MIGPQKEMAEVPLLMTMPMTLTIAPAAISADFSDFAYLRIHTRIASSTRLADQADHNEDKQDENDGT